MGWVGAGEGHQKHEVIEESRRRSGSPQATASVVCHVGLLIQPSAVHQSRFKGAEVIIFIYWLCWCASFEFRPGTRSIKSQGVRISRHCTRFSRKTKQQKKNPAPKFRWIRVTAAKNNNLNAIFSSCCTHTHTPLQTKPPRVHSDLRRRLTQCRRLGSALLARKRLT